MRTRLTEFALILGFLGLTALYYSVPFGAEDTDKVFITITTFFFSIFMGFFISRQGARYTKLREIISTFDGKLSGAYRAAQNINPEIQREIGSIIRNHYTVMIEKQSWNHHFVNKSNTISSVHQLLEDKIGPDTKLESLPAQAVGRVLANVQDAQVLRKNMIMLFQERIPSFQWFLIIFFMIVLLLSISVIPSVGFLFGSILKAAFVTSIISVILILKNLDNLHLFEQFIGENSARDVVAIIADQK